MMHVISKSLPWEINHTNPFNMLRNIILLALVACSVVLLGEAFSPSLGTRHRPTLTHFENVIRPDGSYLSAAGGKKRRRRKQPPAEPSASQQGISEPSAPIEDAALDDEEEEDEEEEEVDLSEIVGVANFKFDGDISVPAPTTDGPAEITSTSKETTTIPLPDIKEVLRKKEMQEEMARIEEEEAATKVKIKRTDKKAMAKLLEQQPYADADDSFFEEEEYGTVSALLGERALPFLGIPTGPLQVGHFIGALVIVLMAFVEYPGFPLTNLPTPLRGALQGGLLTVYGINTVLAVLAVFKASERGQPAGLWVAKTFTVGGLAFDQLTQLPTMEEIEKAKARKGKRALKKKK